MDDGALMLVRLKKRGAWPQGHSWVGTRPPSSKNGGGAGLSAWRGVVIEVEPNNTICRQGGKEFHVTDERMLSAYETRSLGICEHFLIDDLDAYDSDYADEQAEIGDLATVAIPQTVKAR